MRRIFTLLLGFIAFATSSCDDKSTEVTTDTIALSRNNIAFAVEGGITTVSVASPSQWEASCPDNWVTLSREKDFLKVSAEDNGTGDLRSSVITIRSSSDEHTLEVHQAYSRTGVSISVSANKKIDLDSEGDYSTFSVTANNTWTVSSSENWITIARNDNNSTVTVSAPANTEKSRTGVVTVTVSDGTISESREITISQIAHGENPYFQLLGRYALFAENWYFGGKSLGVSGIATFCTITKNEYSKTNKTVDIKGLFLSNAVVKGSYDNRTGKLAIETGSLVLTQSILGKLRYNYMMQINMDTGKILGGLITGSLGRGKDDQGVEQKAILISGRDPGYNAMGLSARDEGTSGYKAYSDLYYAAGEMYLVEIATPTTTQSLVRAAADVVPASDALLFSNN